MKFKNNNDNTKNISAFVCEVEVDDGQKQYYRAFAETAEQARRKIAGQFPSCCVGSAIPYKEWLAINK